MSLPNSAEVVGRVASLHVHPRAAGEPLTAVEVFHALVGQGLVEDARYFNRRSRRQVTLIEREQVAEHAGALGVGEFAAGAVRSNVETTGVNLVALIGQRVEVGTAVLDFYEPRTPCRQMDELCPGLRERMGERRQGVLAQVVRSGVIRVGDAIRLAKPDTGS
ncbi:MAG: hypothetical protein RL514_2144 [Verrucomicrobiota bacterium]